MLARILIAVLLCILIYIVLIERLGFPLWVLIVLGIFIMVIAVLTRKPNTDQNH